MIMPAKTKTRYVGVIPPHETRHKKYIEDLKAAILPNWRIVPETMFYLLSYRRLLDVSSKGGTYDVILAARFKDEHAPEDYNVLSAALEIRERLGRETVFILSFSELLAQMKGLDASGEKKYLDLLFQRENDPRDPSLGGVIYTSSSEPLFLLSVLGDVLGNPQPYLAKTVVHHIESQADFLNHPPGATQAGIGQ